MAQQVFNYSIRSATAADEPILWDMLFYAANMADDGATSSAAARAHPYLAEYVVDWGRAGDLGVIAIDTVAGAALGAAWLRQLAGPEKHYLSVADNAPELAIAVVPAAIGQGIGGALLGGLLDRARGRYPAVALSVREHNPAIRLYQRHGFVVVDTITNRVGGRSFVMQAVLSDLANDDRPRTKDRGLH